MAIWSDIADWVGPSPNDYPGDEQTPLWVVLHIQQGTEAGTIAWQRNPASKVSSHFLAPKIGRLAQMLDTRDASWSVVVGNLRALSIECEGNSGDSLTPDQIEACAQVLARAHTLYSIPLAIVSPPTPGLTGHGLGGAAWGGHYDCPGDPILAQRPAIISRAAQIAGAPDPTGGTTMAQATIDHAAIAREFPDLPDLATKFAATSAPEETAALWGDIRAAAAAEYGRQLLAEFAEFKKTYSAPPPVDVDALAAALAPKLTAGASAEEIAHDVVMYFGSRLTVPAAVSA